MLLTTFTCGKYITIQGNCFLVATLHLLVIQEKSALVCHFISSHKLLAELKFQEIMIEFILDNICI